MRLISWTLRSGSEQQLLVTVIEYVTKTLLVTKKVTSYVTQQLVTVTMPTTAQK